jgi:DnaK suppressor protein
VRGLSASQLRDLEARLHNFEKELKGSLEGKAVFFNASAMAESLIKGDDAEVAEKQRASNAALQELDILKTRLQLVRRALAKMEAGVYGFCEETEEPIGYERLSVVPWARFAVHVQEKLERRMRDFKVSRLRSEA